MERNSKHGVRVDDAMAAESTESRVEESREKEPYATPPAHYEVELRSELAKRLRGSAFPADRNALERVATDEQAPNQILDLLRGLPDGRTFENTEDVWRAVNR